MEVCLAQELLLERAINPKIIYEQSSQFDLYNGRGLDLSFVGAAEVDEDGNG